MSYPSGGSGYNQPATPSSAPSFPQQPGSATGAGAGAPGSSVSGQSSTGAGPASNDTALPFYLTAGVAALGVINFLLGFTPHITQNSQDVGMGVHTPEVTRSFFAFPGAAAPLIVLLAGGLLAGISLLPKQNWLGASAAASGAGFLGLLFVSFTLPDGYSAAWGTWVVVFLGLVQTAAAVVAVLFESGIMTPPAPKPAAPQAVPQGGPQAGYGTQGGYGQQPYGQAQPGQYGQAQTGQTPVTPGQPSQPAAYGQYGQQPSYGQAQQAQSPYGQQPAYGQQYGQQQAQSPYGQSAYGQQPYGAQQGYGAQQRPQQQAGPGTDAPADAGATQHIGAAAQQQQPYGAPSFGQQGSTSATPSAPAKSAGPFGEEQTANPAADATRAFRPGEDDK